MENPKTTKQDNKRKISRSSLIKGVGLLAFVLFTLVICVLIWPYIGGLFEPGGVERLVADVRSSGVLGVLMLLGMQFLQVIVAFIPGEVVQIAAGMMYGPWFGALIILVGCYFSMWIIYELVHRLGRPFVEEMVSTEWLCKFEQFEASGKLDSIVFILFLIPGLPKDVFSYIVPLTNMPRQRFLFLATVGRIPGVVGSTIAASGLVTGDYTMSIVVFSVLGALAVLAIIFKDKLLALMHRCMDNRSHISRQKEQDGTRSS